MTRQPPDREAVKVMNAKVVDEFRANHGKVGGPFDGNELLLLTTTGAKSGQPGCRRCPADALTGSSW